MKLSNNFSFMRYAVGFMDFENSSKKRTEELLAPGDIEGV
jgi:hypothetical protein